jgi:hypothetical protein
VPLEEESQSFVSFNHVRTKGKESEPKTDRAGTVISDPDCEK